MENLSYENEFDLQEHEPVEGSFLYEWFHTKIGFNTEVPGTRKRPISPGLDSKLIETSLTPVSKVRAPQFLF